jgi:hypothetical protein
MIAVLLFVITVAIVTMALRGTIIGKVLWLMILGSIVLVLIHSH